MHPQTFLKTFWRLELRPQVFVAMSFAPRYETRFRDVIKPAVESMIVGGEHLTTCRVDVSKSGDSILTSISDGIAHSRLVLADVSSIGKDSVTGQPYRNANVMYEVGIALACRQPSEVLLVRDDHDEFLFDVSTIPHVTLDFTNVDAAVQSLSECLSARLREQEFVHDARVRIAMSSLSGEETLLLRTMSKYPPPSAWGQKAKGIATWFALATSRMLDKGIIKMTGEFQGGAAAFAFTQFGWVVRQKVISGLRKYKSDKPPEEVAPSTDENDKA